MTTPELPVCPKCKQTDQVQKVSSLYGLNTKEWIETTSYTDADGEIHYTDERHQAHTLLGLKLKPPDKPGPPAHPGIWLGVGLVATLFIFSFLCSFAIFPAAIVVTGLVTELPFELPDIAGMPAWTFLAVAGGCLLLLVLVVLVWVGVLVKRRYDLSMADFREKKTRFEREDLPRWESAMRRWNELYFCLRDETVFHLREQKAIQTDDLQKYLMDPYYRR